MMANCPYATALRAVHGRTGVRSPASSRKTAAAKGPATEKTVFSESAGRRARRSPRRGQQAQRHGPHHESRAPHEAGAEEPPRGWTLGDAKEQKEREEIHGDEQRLGRPDAGVEEPVGVEAGDDGGDQAGATRVDPSGQPVAQHAASGGEETLSDLNGAQGRLRREEKEERLEEEGVARGEPADPFGAEQPLEGQAFRRHLHVGGHVSGGPGLVGEDVQEPKKERREGRDGQGHARRDPLEPHALRRPIPPRQRGLLPVARVAGRTRSVVRRRAFER